ncbi:UNVERIFIED_CONTAM: hypothetical protein GTU68_024415 [Idotea baltica]|nr:hypothetical protein [Idotea baltica]
MVSTFMDVPVEERQEVLETFDLRKRLELVANKLGHVAEVLRLSKKIREETQGTLEEAQREYYLREQLRAINRELGESEDKSSEVSDLKKAIDEANMPEEAEKESKKELKRLQRMPDGAAEASIVRTFLEVMIELPWDKSSVDRLDIRKARRILDQDHYGLEKVKDRIIEFLAVRKLKPSGKNTSLCLVGPPGVGKTSLGKSIARAMGREFVRASLGGVHDEAEVRGHRRTYVGALPGTIVQGIRRAGTRNPVFMLDEMDKLGRGVHGDPSSALLEVLDPEQNNTFRDNYLAVPFDLSQVLFISTANVLAAIPPPLRDRFEVIQLPGYTREEKHQIAARYLVGRRLENTGLTDKQCSFTPDAIDFIIESYTREAGVRDLERRIGAICRHVATRIVEKSRRSMKIRPAEAGAIPKDGPSAGVALYTALASLYTRKLVNPKLAMTGEISLRGLVLPVGGVKEKVLGALAAGIDTVLLPAKNKADLDDIPQSARKQLEFHFIEHVDQALELAFAAPKKKPAKRKAPASQSKKKAAKKPARKKKAAKKKAAKKPATRRKRS